MMPRPSSEHISGNVTVELFSCIEKAGMRNCGRPDSICPAKHYDKFKTLVTATTSLNI
jgi:hypothetical protein